MPAKGDQDAGIAYKLGKNDPSALAGPGLSPAARPSPKERVEILDILRNVSDCTRNTRKRIRPTC
jgi:hypothetical protein